MVGKLSFALITIFGLVVENHSAAVGNLKEDYESCPDPKLAKVVLDHRPIYIESEFFKVQTYIYKFPGAVINTHRITCIYVRDMDSTGNGGTVQPLEGGVNDFKFSAELKSKRGYALNYEIVIYANDETTTTSTTTTTTEETTTEDTTTEETTTEETTTEETTTEETTTEETTTEETTTEETTTEETTTEETTTEETTTEETTTEETTTEETTTEETTTEEITTEETTTEETTTDETTTEETTTEETTTEETTTEPSTISSDEPESTSTTTSP